MAATEEAERLGAAVVRTTRVTGSYETPLLADRLLARRDVDALVVLGYIERGETLHGEVMGHMVHRAALRAVVRSQDELDTLAAPPGRTRRR